MLKGIPSVISPELLKILDEMGHGDELLLADANYPSSSMGRPCVRADGHDITTMLEAILPLFPLDTYVETPVLLMGVTQDASGNFDVEGDPPVWTKYHAAVDANQAGIKFGKLGRFEFYDRGKTVYAVVATGETSLYGNVIIKKGIIV
ncbi:MAG: fucose isomerase [Clostridiales Family XIII bacterium]|jgi:L-fucose mutarotase|nr:fucose isomerase [Clostridiales Family XIII bacterium]